MHFIYTIINEMYEYNMTKWQNTVYQNITKISIIQDSVIAS